MPKDLYSKPIAFAVVATLVILVGTVVTMFLPMFTEGMHPRLEALAAPSPLELAGRDIYQREGCNNCHTQTVRPLKTEVLRYGEYSKAGEFAYDRPFLWGSKRTGPDLARIGRKYPDAWHERHFADPQSFFERSNMPSYGWLAERSIAPDTVQARMDAQRLPYEPAQIDELGTRNELDALVAYMQWIGTAVKVSEPKPEGVDDETLAMLALENPMAGDAAAIGAGGELYADYACADCHGEGGEGDIGPALDDLAFLGVEEDAPDGYYYYLIHQGSEDGFPLEGYVVEEAAMPGYSSDLTEDEIWKLVSYMRSLQSQE